MLQFSHYLQNNLMQTKNIFAKKKKKNYRLLLYNMHYFAGKCTVMMHFFCYGYVET